MYTVLFDIDGTLIDTDGAGRHAMTVAVHEEFGVPNDSVGIRFAGRTDRAIIGDFFRLHGMTDSRAHFDQLRERFLEWLKATLPQRRGTVLPGVVDLLNRLSAHKNVRLGLLTGNMQSAARIKLDHFQLSHFFYNGNGVLGGFGDRHHDRNDVAREVMSHLGDATQSAPERVWVVGDTLADVDCARAVGAQVLAVETGGVSREELASAHPDVLLSDLTQAESWLLSLT